MTDHNFYVNEHRWSESDWETTQLGFHYGIDPQFYDIDQATNEITKTLKKIGPELSSQSSNWSIAHQSFKKGTVALRELKHMQSRLNDPIAMN
jgi:hypothetical protein